MAMLAAGCAAWGQSNAASADKVDHASAYYHYALAHVYAELAGEPGGREYIDKALENYKEALQADPGAAAISEELAEFYVQAGLLADAESDAQKALAKDPNDLGALRLLARIYTSQIGGQNNRINQDMLKKAIEQYKKITGVAPKDVDAWVMLGRLEKAAQDNAEAERAYKKALEVDPDSEDALTGLSLVYLDLGNSQAAADTLKALAEKNSSARSLRALAETYEQMKEFGLAADTLKKALALNPPDAGEVRQALAQDLIQRNALPRLCKSTRTWSRRTPATRNPTWVCRGFTATKESSPKPMQPPIKRWPSIRRTWTSVTTK